MTQQATPSPLANQQQPHGANMHLQLQRTSAGTQASSSSASPCTTTTTTTTCSSPEPSSSSSPSPSSYPAVLSLRRQLYGPNTSLMFDQVRKCTPVNLLSACKAQPGQPGTFGSIRLALLHRHIPVVSCPGLTVRPLPNARPCQPLLLVKGRGTYLYDSEGVPYLDCINNVAHLGHGNEEVGWWGGCGGAGGAETGGKAAGTRGAGGVARLVHRAATLTGRRGTGQRGIRMGRFGRLAFTGDAMPLHARLSERPHSRTCNRASFSLPLSALIRPLSPPCAPSTPFSPPLPPCPFPHLPVAQVAAAVFSQLRTLNTNSRFLHPDLTAYSQLLLDTINRPGLPQHRTSSAPLPPPPSSPTTHTPARRPAPTSPAAQPATASGAVHKLVDSVGRSTPAAQAAAGIDPYTNISNSSSGDGGGSSSSRPLEVVYLVCSGSEANDLALRMITANRPAASHVAVMAGAYHGHTTALMPLSSYKFWGRGGGGRQPHVHVVPCPDVYRWGAGGVGGRREGRRWGRGWGVGGWVGSKVCR